MKAILLALLLSACHPTEMTRPDSGSPEGNQPAFRDATATHLRSPNTTNNTMDGHAVDIDQDGDTDLILAIEFRSNIILINDGSGVLTDESAARFPAAGHDSEDIAVADFDADGDLDIIFVSEDDQTNEYYLNNGAAVFSSVNERIPVRGTSNSVETADLNQDGAPDLIIGNQGQNVILINDGRGYFQDETAERLPRGTATTQDIELADIDADGDLDIIEANETFNQILINNGSGVFQDETKIRLPGVNDQTREVDLGDIDQDGDLDIFFANVDFGGIGNPQNRLLLNDGTGNFTEITGNALPNSAFRTVDADFFDIDQDGFLDIISGNRFNGPEMMVLLNDGQLHFTDQTKAFFPVVNMYVFDFQLADFNQDGVIDIYCCNFRGQDLLLLGRPQ